MVLEHRPVGVNRGPFCYMESARTREGVGGEETVGLAVFSTVLSLFPKSYDTSLSVLPQQMCGLSTTNKNSTWTLC